jgi:chromosome segregation ATPase
MSTIETVNEVALQRAGNRFNQIPVEHRNLIGHLVAFHKEREVLIAEILRDLTLRPADPRSPGYAASGWIIGAKNGHYSPLLVLERLIAEIEQRPDFEAINGAVSAALDEVRECEEAIREDRRRADQALADLQSKEGELKAKALAALQDDPDLAMLRAEVAAAEAVLAGAQPPVDPASAARAEKKAAALSGIRRKGQPLVSV